jgi:hypothetical protein
MSYRGSLTPYNGKKESKQQANNIVTEDSEEESGDESDIDMSYHVRGQSCGSGEKYSCSLVTLEILMNPTKLSKLVHIKRNW